MSRSLAARGMRRPRGRRVASWTLGVLLLLVLTGCSQATEDSWKRLGLPESGSDRAPYMHDLWIGAWIAAMVVGVFVWGLIFWVSVRYRRRSEDDLPTQVRYNLPIEVLYTVAPVIVVGVLFFYTVNTQNSVLETASKPDHDVVVTAYQWAWVFNYVGEDAVGGDGHDVYDVGTVEQEPEVWLVKDQTVTFELTSSDVIHSFWVPAFYFKMDVIPGRPNAFSMTPTKTGEFVGRCAELCGVSHSKMLFTVVVTDQDSFDQHMQDLEDAGNVGIVKGREDTERINGLEEGDLS